MLDRLRAGLIECASGARDVSFDASAGRHAAKVRAIEPAWRDAAAATRDGDADRARSLAERVLFEALEALDETRGLFELNATLQGIRFGTRDLEIDLFAPTLALAIEVDGHFHFVDREAYRRDRRKDALLQRHGLFVVRALAADVVECLDDVLDAVLENVRHARTRTEIR
jgi:very-short-patch-repair endonuclease